MARAAHDTPDAHGHDAHAAHDTHDAHGHDDAHGGPHESNWWILAPLVFLAIPAFAAGFLQWPGWFGISKYPFEHFVEDLVFEETILANKMLYPFSWGVAIPSILLAVLGVLASVAYYYGAKGDLGLVRRFAPARWLYNFLKNKYYLDHLWTGVVVGSIKGPIAKAAYWVNQNVLDGVINTAGKGAAATGRYVYDIVDQKIIDGAVNGSGKTASEGGGVLRLLQTGRVQNYAALFLAAAGIFALALALFIS